MSKSEEDKWCPYLGIYIMGGEPYCKLGKGQYPYLRGEPCRNKNLWQVCSYSLCNKEEDMKKLEKVK